ncbi:hypothetical protein [Campylobacter curvus]|uniref:hypothetical protein n=1 Tax=Campylobacter curvus TaxID=200 RepID=UPI00146FDF67|nr:hypothetical protein [Campylobacter curvus]
MEQEAVWGSTPRCVGHLIFFKSKLWPRELEANLRAKVELENARTVIATTRALKNAAAMIKEMKFLQIMELLQNAVKTGKNTLNVSEMLAE